MVKWGLGHELEGLFIRFSAKILEAFIYIYVYTEGYLTHLGSPWNLLLLGFLHTRVTDI